MQFNFPSSFKLLTSLLAQTETPLNNALGETNNCINQLAHSLSNLAARVGLISL